MSYTVTKVMTTETAHRLMDYEGKCAHIHGHSYRWEVTASLNAQDHERGLQDNGIAIDFKDLKAAMRKVIFDEFDHALVLASYDPLWKVSDVLADAADGTKQKILIMNCNPTAENFAQMVAARIQGELEYGKVESVRVWETANSYAEYIPFVY